MAGPYDPASEPTVFAVGATVYWTDGGVAKSGVVYANQSVVHNGGPNYAGGEALVEIKATVGNQTTVFVRASELSLSA